MQREIVEYLWNFIYIYIKYIYIHVYHVFFSPLFLVPIAVSNILYIRAVHASACCCYINELVQWKEREKRYITVARKWGRSGGDTRDTLVESKGS